MDVVKESPVYASGGFTTGGTVVTITPVSVSHNLLIPTQRESPIQITGRPVSRSGNAKPKLPRSSRNAIHTSKGRFFKSGCFFIFY